MTHKPSPLADPTRCPGCGAAVPRQYQLQDMFQPEYVCQGCRGWQLDTGIGVSFVQGIRGPAGHHQAYPPLWSSRDPADPPPAAPVLVGGYYLVTPPATAPVRPGDPGRPPPPKRPRGTANQRMLAEIERNSESLYWTLPEWCQFLGRAKSTVSDTAAWVRCKEARAQRKLERQERQDRHRTPGG
jgi:hypothetical protein